MKTRHSSQPRSAGYERSRSKDYPKALKSWTVSPNAASMTRQQARFRARRLEYLRLGAGIGERPVFDLPRRQLRAIARAIVKRQWQSRLRK